MECGSRCTLLNFLRLSLRCLRLFYSAVTPWSIVNNMKTVKLRMFQNIYPVITRNFDYLLIKHYKKEDKTSIVG